MFSMDISVKSRIPNYMKDAFFDPEEFDYLITDELQKEALSKWAELANEALNTTAENYIDGLSSTRDDKKVDIILEGALPVMQEKGAVPFDMKPGLLKGKDYVNVPIEHSKPGSGGPNEMSKTIYSKAKNLNYGQRFTDSTSKRKTSWHGEYKHKDTLYKDMLKNKKSYEKQSGAGYVTFRRVSKNSDPSSWIHPGFTPLNLADKVANHLADVYDGIINKIKMKLERD